MGFAPRSVPGLRFALSALLAALAAPWASLVAVFAHVAVINLWSGPGPTTIWLDAAMFVPPTLYLSYVVTFVAGIPAHCILWYLGRSGTWSYVSAGALLAVPASAVIFGLSALGDWRAAAYLLSFSVLVGTVVAATFRAIFVFFLEPERAV